MDGVAKKCMDRCDTLDLQARAKGDIHVDVEMSM